MFDWNKIYWNFSHYSSKLDKLGELAASHLDTLKIAREVHSTVFYSHVPLNKIIDISVIEYHCLARQISTSQHIRDLLTTSLNLKLYQVASRTLSLTCKLSYFEHARRPLIEDRLRMEDIAAVEILTANYPNVLGYGNMQLAISYDSSISLTYLVKTVPTLVAKNIEKLGRLAVTRACEVEQLAVQVA
ncbi:Hypothetical protein POVR2_LOCUS406 [uncultured virus]|nr:Hypothetical protein POVR2_LOCUS406 [uncultured virus]